MTVLLILALLVVLLLVTGILPRTLQRAIGAAALGIAILAVLAGAGMPARASPAAPGMYPWQFNYDVLLSAAILFIAQVLGNAYVMVNRRPAGDSPTWI